MTSIYIRCENGDADFPVDSRGYPEHYKDRFEICKDAFLAGWLVGDDLPEGTVGSFHSIKHYCPHCRTRGAVLQRRLFEKIAA